MHRHLELICIFILFAVYGAWSVPDSNEPYYVLKAVRFWQTDFLPNDTFLATRDAHTVFYLAFGWLSFFLTPNAMVWTGRIVTWLALAWTWRRLAHAVLDDRSVTSSVSPFASSVAVVVAASAFAYFLETCHCAGEWVFGGVEGKSFAFPLIFLGLEQLVRGHWRRVWLCFGMASAFHVLVGGWSVIAAAMAWMYTPRTERASLLSMLPALVVGGLISLAGVVPALEMNRGVAPDVRAFADEVYTFVRLSHHLVPHIIPWEYSARFALLTVVMLLLAVLLQRNELLGRPAKLLVRFVFGSLVIAAIGLCIDVVTTASGNKQLAASLLRFYWFRLADVAVPLGTAMLATLVAVRIVAADVESLFSKNLRFVREAMLVLATGFVGFCVIEAVLFGWLFFSWDRPAEPHIAWLAVVAVGIVVTLLCKRTLVPKTLLPLIVVALVVWGPLAKFFSYAETRTRFVTSRIDSPVPFVAYHWRDVCRWIAANTRGDSRFLVPRESATFKWYANRADVGVWKEIPQDAVSIVKWYDAMTELFSAPTTASENAPPNSVAASRLRDWDKSVGQIIAEMDDASVAALVKKYQCDYIVVASFPPQPKRKFLKLCYENDVYRVYAVNGGEL
ncbi:MAG: DUF6798 domain-containing protein [Thermoguttaceae bacterium]